MSEIARTIIKSGKMTDQARDGLTIDDIIGNKREQILALAAQHGALNVRVFGSVARGEATPESDLDLLVDFRDGATIWGAVGLWQDLQELLDREVSLVGEERFDTRFMRRILKDAIPL